MKNRTLVLVALPLILLGIGGLFYFKHISSPEYSLLQIKKAYEQHDITLFEKYVDIKTLTDGILDNILKGLSEKSTAYSDAEKLGENLGNGLINLMRPQVEELWRQQILKLVESGEIANVKGRQGFEELWFKNDRTSFKRIKGTKKDGKVTIVDLEFDQPRFDTTQVIQLRMRDKGNYWQLFEVSNLFEYIKSLDNLEEKRVNRLNEEVKLELSKKFRVEKASVKTEVVKYYHSYKNFTYTIDFVNASNIEIVAINLEFNINDSNGNEVESGYIIENGLSLGPGKKYRFQKKENMESFSTPTPKSLTVDIKIGELKFGDGTKIEWRNKWEGLSKTSDK